MNDSVEYGATLELTVGGNKVWLKLGGTTSVRESETPDEAMARLSDWVEKNLDAKMKEWAG